MRRREFLVSVSVAAASLAIPNIARAQAAITASALVIGNSNYLSVPSLPNASNDARAVNDLFAHVSVTVDRYIDLPSGQMGGIIESFADRAAGTDVALIYYAGHGIEADNQPYLLPVDVTLTDPEAAARTIVPVTRLLEPLLGHVKLAVFLGDMCRTNPFGDQPIPIDGGRGVVTGVPTGYDFATVLRGPTPVENGTELTVVDEPLSSLTLDGTNSSLIIAMATSSGRPAYDGTGQNSPFATALLERFGNSDADLATVLSFIASDVFLATGGRQKPVIRVVSAPPSPTD